jgi:hypothetical protein
MAGWMLHGNTIEITDLGKGLEAISDAVWDITRERIDKDLVARTLEKQNRWDYEVFVNDVMIYLLKQNGKCQLSVCYHPSSIYGSAHAADFAKRLSHIS